MISQKPLRWPIRRGPELVSCRLDSARFKEPTPETNDHWISWSRLARSREWQNNLPSGKSEPSLSIDIPWGMRGWLVMFGSCWNIMDRNGSWIYDWCCCATDGELDGTGSAPSLLWLVSTGAGEGVGDCCWVLLSRVGMEAWGFVASSSLVFLSALLAWEKKPVDKSKLTVKRRTTTNLAQH